MVAAVRPGLRKVPGGGAVAAGDGAGEIIAAPARCGLIGLPTVWGGLEIGVTVVNGEGAGFVLGDGRGGEWSAGGEYIAVGDAGIAQPEIVADVREPVRLRVIARLVLPRIAPRSSNPSIGVDRAGTAGRL